MPSRSGHLERTAQEPRDENLYEVTLGRIDQVNERIRLFRLMLKSPIKFLPGQWLDTFVPDISKPGGFTITSPPSAAASASSAPYLELAVQESPENPPAAWLWRLRDEILGSTMHVRVGGSFVFPPPPTTTTKVDDDEEDDVRALSKVVLVAGGVGINPLMSMLSAVAEDGNLHHVPVEVVYASKVPRGGARDVLFLERIAGLFDKGGLRGRMRLFLTGLLSADEGLALVVEEGLRRRYPSANIGVYARRFTADDIADGVRPEEKANAAVYVCGPPVMADEMVAALADENGIGMDKGRVLMEKWW